MKSTDNFKNTIHTHLQSVAKKDPGFSKKLMNPKKNIDDCITYILNQVKKSGCVGFADEEIFGMALHYFDESNVKPGAKINANVVVNHKIELTKDEIEEARKEAKDKLIAEEIEKRRKKPVKPKQEKKTDVEPTLFDLS